MRQVTTATSALVASGRPLSFLWSLSARRGPMSEVRVLLFNLVTGALIAGAVAAVFFAAAGVRSGNRQVLVPTLLFAAVLLVLAWGTRTGGSWVHERQQTAELRESQIEMIEEKYDVFVEHSTFGEPGYWRLSGAWLICYLSDEEATAPEDIRLICDPDSSSDRSFRELDRGDRS